MIDCFILIFCYFVQDMLLTQSADSMSIDHNAGWPRSKRRFEFLEHKLI